MTLLTLVLLSCYFLFFIDLKLELLTQFTALNDEKYVLSMKNDPVQNAIISLIHSRRIQRYLGQAT